jgi:hypothetical protein
MIIWLIMTTLDHSGQPNSRKCCFRLPRGSKNQYFFGIGIGTPANHSNVCSWELGFILQI